MKRSPKDQVFLSDLALVRTAYSSERSLMAWVRTSVSLYTFGFSISKFIDFLKLQQEGIQLSVGFRRVGLVLIAMGIVAVAFAMIDHVRRMQKMHRLGLQPSTRSVLPAGAAIALVLTGIVALVGIWSG
jgi:putative membrane protein